MEADTRIEVIENACQTEVDRNVGPLAERAAGGLSAAAHSIAAVQNASVVVLTGAYIPWATPPAAETDGPPGAALLVAGLLKLGISAQLLTDHWCHPVLAAAAREVGPNIPIEVCDGDPLEVDRLLVDYKLQGVTHLVAVERMGPAADGKVRNFRGEDVTSFTAGLGPFLSKEQPWTAIGVGDGGNELGMGNIPASVVAAEIDHGEQIHCVIGCKHLIVAGVSNWGALGLLLAVAMLRGTASGAVLECVSAESHRRVVEACVAAGAVDGTLGRSVASVDGLDLRGHDTVIERMRTASGLEA